MAESSASPNEELNLKLQSVFSELLGPQASLSAEAAAERIVNIAQDHVNEHSNDPIDSAAARRNSGPKRDTPGAETFSWSLWECLLKAIGNWDSEEQFDEHLNRAIGLAKSLQARPEDELKWVIWGEDTSIRALPLIGPSMREANNGKCDSLGLHSPTHVCSIGPFCYTGPDDDALSRADIQDALAGAPSSAHDENVDLASKCRKEWLALQAFMARLRAECGLESFAVCGIWAIRDGLEDWPTAPPSILDGSSPSTGERPAGEDTAAYHALMVEGAAVWLRFAAAEMYASAEIWGPNGNPEWNRNQGEPGRGGARWDGVDGMDADKKRWGLWRDVLDEISAWYDKEAAAGRGSGWKVKDATVTALKAMDAVERK
jgi:hypothetical protein